MIRHAPKSLILCSLDQSGVVTSLSARIKAHVCVRLMRVGRCLPGKICKKKPNFAEEKTVDQEKGIFCERERSVSSGGMKKGKVCARIYFYLILDNIVGLRPYFD